MEKSCLLIAVNAKYIHTNLAVRCLKAFCQRSYSDIRIQEHSINDHFDNILKQIYNSKSDIYAFSCYIWNIDIVLKLCSSLKKVKPDAVIILGGPEVSFDSEKLLAEHAFIDYIVRGEGEETLLELLLHLSGDDSDVSSVAGLTYRSTVGVTSSPERRLLASLDYIPFPYDDFEQLGSKIIYYETSRGCPFNCQYCLSSTIHGVRFLSMDRVKRELKLFIEKGVKQVKLVDRTFNCNKNHSLEIINYIIELKAETNFHFEMAADLLDDEMISVLAKAPKHMFQYEIGVQSTNPHALREISRAMDLDKVKENVRKLQKAGNSHMHLDLIAGLPFEDLESFKKSFDEVHELMPDMLQLGFLKVLKGSGIMERAEEYMMQYNSFNPYEVLSTKWISYEEITMLKELEQLLELYYNSGRFANSLKYLFRKHYTSYFSFYESFSYYWKEKGLYKSSQSTRELYNILYSFALQQGFMSTALNELIKLDWLMYFNSGTMPESIKRYPHGEVKNSIQDYIKSSTEITEALFGSVNIDSKSLLKNIFYEVFYTDVLHSPEALQQWIVFFAKDQQGELKHYAKKLSEILNK
jgi:radical SAM superfamily enzyme YgiQ (UPF0313 family)